MTLEDEHDALMVRMYDLEEKVDKLMDTLELEAKARSQQYNWFPDIW